MSEKKFKVGDRVKCVESFTKKDLIGKIGVVMSVHGEYCAVKFYDFHSGHTCVLEGHDLGNSGWNCTFNMLELVKTESIVIYQKDNKVFAKNTITGEIAKATCHKDDTFDFAIGAKLALERLLPTETKVSYVKQDEYEIGDIVKIRDWDDMVAEFGTFRTMIFDNLTINSHVRFTEGQKKYCGNEYEIISKHKTEDGTVVYKLDDCFVFIFTKDHFVGKRVEETDTKKTEEPKYKPGDIVKLTDDYLNVPKGTKGVIVGKHPHLNTEYAVDFKFKYAATHDCCGLLTTDTGYFLMESEFEKVN